jgi:hypothetical protein
MRTLGGTLSGVTVALTIPPSLSCRRSPHRHVRRLGTFVRPSSATGEHGHAYSSQQNGSRHEFSPSLFQMQKYR